MVRDWFRSVLDRLRILINRRSSRIRTGTPILRELYERAADRAEVEAAAEWHRCFDATAETRRRGLVLGASTRPSAAVSFQLIDSALEEHGRELCNWSAPVVRELPVRSAVASRPTVS